MAIATRSILIDTDPFSSGKSMAWVSVNRPSSVVCGRNVTPTGTTPGEAEKTNPDCTTTSMCESSFELEKSSRIARKILQSRSGICPD